jgi:hypothetical protein
VLLLRTLESKINIFLNKPILSLTLIGTISLILRLVYLPFDIPIILDGLDYFWYASDISFLKGFPPEYSIGNSGWPIFLSAIFSFFEFDNFLNYMNLQRHVTIFLSIATIIPVYFICKRFFDKSYAIIGASLFAFDPRIIQNSLLGITDPLYIILSAISFCLFFTKQKKFFYLSFIVAAFAAFVRSEGIFIFAAFTVIFFVMHKKESRKIKTFLIASGVYLSTLLPVIFWRIQNNGTDLISGRILVESNNVFVQYSSDQGWIGLVNYATHAIGNSIQLGGWSLIPVFILFIPFGIYFSFKQKDSELKYILLLIFILLIPVFFAFSIASDVRYIFYTFPLFCLVSLLGIKGIKNKLKVKNTFFILILGGVLISSITFLEIKSIDNEYQKEVFEIGKEIINKTDAINDFYPQSAFLEPAAMPEKWPVLKSSFQIETIRDDNNRAVIETSYDSKIHIFNTENYSSIKQFIKNNKNNGLTHIVVDNYEKRSAFLKEVYFHDENYPYLEKIFDSEQAVFSKYHLKIYKINYSTFN